MKVVRANDYRLTAGTLIEGGRAEQTVAVQVALVGRDREDAAVSDRPIQGVTRSPKQHRPLGGVGLKSRAVRGDNDGGTSA